MPKNGWLTNVGMTGQDYYDNSDIPSDFKAFTQEELDAIAETEASAPVAAERVLKETNCRDALHNAIRLKENAPYSPVENRLIADNTVDEALELFKGLPSPIPLDIDTLVSLVLSYERGVI